MGRAFAIVLGMAMLASPRAIAADNTAPPAIVQSAPPPGAPPPPSSPASAITAPVPVSPHTTTADDYPMLSRWLHEEGRTLVQFTINADGTVSDPVIMESSGHVRLDAASLDLVKRWLYHPAIRDGKPIAVRSEAYIQWKLTQPELPEQTYFTMVYMKPDDYPPAAKANGEEGFVAVVVYLDPDGNVLDSTILHGSGFADLDSATADMIAKRWHFKAAEFEGKPSRSAVGLIVVWSLSPNGGQTGASKN